jgi:hypothetical protein
MTSSRAESQQPFGRRRSNTAHSIYRNPPTVLPLKVDDCVVLCSWVHDLRDSASVLFNQSWWPGVAEGDMLRVTPCNDDRPSSSGFLFVVPKDDGLCPKPQLQVRSAFSYIILSLIASIAVDISTHRRGFRIQKQWGGHHYKGKRF